VPPGEGTPDDEASAPAPGPASNIPAPDDATFVSTLLGGEPELSARQVAAELGVPLDDVLRLWQVMGFPATPPDEPLFVTDDLAMFATGLGARDLLGQEGLEQFARVLASSVARIADAAMSAARTQLTGPLVVGGASDEELVAVGNVAAGALGDVTLVLGPLFRHHAVVARRRSQSRHLGLPVEAYDRALQLVGFLDLVSSTALHGRTSPTLLAHALAGFEAAGADEVTEAGGRVIKHIGDEVMFTTNDAASGCRAALGLVELVQHHPVLTQLRGALAWGEVVPQDGDVYGATVNVAARATHLAEPGQVLVTVGTREAASEATDLAFTAAGAHHLRDVGTVELFEVRGTHP
jgi:adenylate cyclase